MEHWKKLLHHRHGPFLIAAIVALAALPVLIAFLKGLAPALSVVIFFALYLFLMALRIPALDGPLLRRRAPPSDEPAPVILIVTLLAAATAMVLLFQVLNRSHQAGIGEIVLAFASVVLGWLTIHTMFAMHYAHRFWRPTDPATTQDADSKVEKRPKWHGGLDFPETKEPGSYDFLYFSFVIGMTAQTSDVAITTTAMRRLNLVHSIVSFFFNAVLIAAAVNAAVSMGGT
jgi:uncharacterized membrane protein